MRLLNNENARLLAQHFLTPVTGCPFPWWVLEFDPTSVSKNSIHKRVDCAVLINEGMPACSNQVGWAFIRENEIATRR